MVKARPIARRKTAAKRQNAWLNKEWRAFKLSLPRGIERDTLLMPDVIAESVCAEAGNYLDLTFPKEYAEWMAWKAGVCYNRNKRFSRLMRAPGNEGRDALYMFMRHWLCGLLFKHQAGLLERLPSSYRIGVPLPVPDDRNALPAPHLCDSYKTSGRRLA